MERAHRERLGLALLPPELRVRHHVQRRVRHVQRPHRRELRDWEVVCRIETGERIGRSPGARRPEKRADEPVAVHPGERELVDRDHPSHDGAEAEQDEPERRRPPRSRRPPDDTRALPRARPPRGRRRSVPNLIPSSDRRSRQRVHQPLVGPRQRREQRDDEGRAREREHNPADRRGTSASLGRPCQPRAERAERGRQEPRHGGGVRRVQVQPLRHRVPRPAEGHRPAEDHRARDEPRRRGDEHPRAEPAPPFQIRDVEVRARRADEHERAEQDERENEGKSRADIGRVQLDAVGKHDLGEPVQAGGGDGCGQRGGKPGARPHRPSARQESDRDPQERVSGAARRRGSSRATAARDRPPRNTSARACRGRAAAGTARRRSAASAWHCRSSEGPGRRTRG